MIKGKGKAFEFLVKQILINVGFEEVKSDDIYIYDGSAGQMINGLGEAHNADVLLEPPVQIPFFAKTRLLIECKDYNVNKVGLNVVRSALGLRTDINAYDILDYGELERRKAQNRKNKICYTRYSYNVAIASTSGFADQAQSMAATYRIPLIELNKYPFWETWKKALPCFEVKSDCYDKKAVLDYISDLCKGMALAITNTGQLVFLYNSEKRIRFPSDKCDISSTKKGESWMLKCSKEEYFFSLPEQIKEHWINEENKSDIIIDDDRIVTRMVAFFRKNGQPQIKMLSINLDKIIELSERANYKEKIHIEKIDLQNTAEYESNN